MNLFTALFQIRLLCFGSSKLGGTGGQRLRGAFAGQLRAAGGDDLIVFTNAGFVSGNARGEFEYYKDEAKTRASRRNGLFTVGDMGYIDPEGWLFLSDRKADMIISGGVNIYPAEIEATLLGHPEVADVAVIGVPDEEWGESVKAVVQPKDLSRASDEFAEELLAWCREHLARYKCPRSVDFRDELPRYPTGKLYKRLLRDEYWAGHTRSI